MNSTSNQSVIVSDSQEKGRGIFATRHIPAGAIVFSCPYIVLGRKSNMLFETELEHYVFRFPFTRSGKPYERSNLSALVFGETSLLNHSDDPNCSWDWDVKARVHRTFTTRDIAEGEELTIDYCWDDEVWDSVGGMKR